MSSRGGVDCGLRCFYFTVATLLVPFEDSDVSLFYFQREREQVLVSQLALHLVSPRLASRGIACVISVSLVCMNIVNKRSK